MKLTITQQVKGLGINVCMAVIRDANISNRSGPLEKLKKEIIEKIQILDISNNQILKGYKELYDKIEKDERVHLHIVHKDDVAL